MKWIGDLFLDELSSLSMTSYASFHWNEFSPPVTQGLNQLLTNTVVECLLVECLLVECLLEREDNHL